MRRASTWAGSGDGAAHSAQRARVQLLRSVLEPGASGEGKDTINCDVEVVHVVRGSRGFGSSLARSGGDWDGN
jgi:hypothetical protein